MDLTPANLEAEMSKDADVISHLEDRDIAVEYYSALCNMRWRKINTLNEAEKIIDRLKGEESDIWSCSWRYAGGVIAHIRNANYNTKEDYMDFYCSGNEGTVSNLVEDSFYRMGWEPAPWNDNDDTL